MCEVVAPVRITQIEVVLVMGLDVGDRHPPGALVSTRFDHQTWQSANFSKRIGFVFEYFLRPSGGGIS